MLKTTNDYKTNRQTWHNDVRVNLLPGDQQIPVGVQQFGRKFLWHLVVLEEVLTASNPFGHFVTCNMIFWDPQIKQVFGIPCSSVETRFSVKSWCKSSSNHPKETKLNSKYTVLKMRDLKVMLLQIIDLENMNDE